MKTTAEMRLLADREETISISEFRARPGEVLMQVQMGKRFLITKARGRQPGKVVAVLAPPELNAIQLGSAVRQLRLAR